MPDYMANPSMGVRRTPEPEPPGKRRRSVPSVPPLPQRPQPRVIDYQRPPAPLAAGPQPIPEYRPVPTAAQQRQVEIDMLIFTDPRVWAREGEQVAEREWELTQMRLTAQ